MHGTMLSMYQATLSPINPLVMRNTKLHMNQSFIFKEVNRQARHNVASKAQLQALPDPA